MIDILGLRLSVTDLDLNELIRQHLPADAPIEDLALRTSPDGIHVTGVYPLFIKVRFEVLWHVTVETGLVKARLAQLKALGIPANIFKSAILKVLEDAVRAEPALRLEGDEFQVDLDRVLKNRGLPIRTNLRSITCQAGTLTLEAGTV